MNRPVRLAPERVWRFYRGGALIDRLRGQAEQDTEFPEDWVGSLTEAHNPGRERRHEGLSQTADGRLLRDLVACDPQTWLGPRHIEAFGAATTGVLVKLLDSAIRLPVHAHPSRAFARRHLDSPFGKTEAWLVVATRSGSGTVHVGMREDTHGADFMELVRAQDAQGMLALLNELTVSAGDLIYVPAGVPHSIGSGLLICELQEPTDFSVLCEWKGFPLSEDVSHLGLGWPRALEALDLSAHEPVRELPEDARRFFDVDFLAADGRHSLPGRFAVFVVTAGEGTLNGEPASGGDTFALPAALTALEIEGGLAGFLCLAPEPDAHGS